MSFEIIGEIQDVEIIAMGPAIRDLARLRRAYGPGRWRKLKGVATVRSGFPVAGCAWLNYTGTKRTV